MRKVLNFSFRFTFAFFYRDTGASSSSSSDYLSYLLDFNSSLCLLLCFSFTLSSNFSLKMSAKCLDLARMRYCPISVISSSVNLILSLPSLGCSGYLPVLLVLMDRTS